MKLIYKVIDWILLIAIFIILLLIYLKTPPTLSDLAKANKTIAELKTKKDVALELLEKHKKEKERTFLEKFAQEFKNRVGIKPKHTHLQYALDKYRENALEKAENQKQKIFMRTPLVIEIKQ
jgi:hypothetical protein